MSINGSMNRVTRSHEEARISYNKISKWYDIASSFERKFREKGLQKLAVKEGEKVLEIGFGTGQCIIPLARLVSDSGRVYGIDISEGMLDITLSRIRRSELSGRVELFLGDGASLPFDSNSFDAILMNFTLELFDTPEIFTVLKECRRVLHTGGRICVVALSKKGAGITLQLYEWARRMLPKYIDCRPIYVQKAMEEADFQTVDAVTMSMWGLPVEVVVAQK